MAQRNGPNFKFEVTIGIGSNMGSGKITQATAIHAVAIIFFVGSIAQTLDAQHPGRSDVSSIHQVSAGRNATFDPFSVMPAPNLVVQDREGTDGQDNDGAEKSSEAFSTEEDELKDAKERSSADSATSSKSSDALSPMQNRQLTLKVQAVSTSNEKIGTGKSPEPAKSTRLSEDSTSWDYPRFSIYTRVYWCPSLIRHYPLYFEDPMLERHGFVRCGCCHEFRQSLVSGARFFSTIPLLPYHMVLQPKDECIYALGNYRPGSDAPCLRSNLPYDSRAALVESASAATFFWAVPL